MKERIIINGYGCDIEVKGHHLKLDIEFGSDGEHGRELAKMLFAELTDRNEGVLIAKPRL